MGKNLKKSVEGYIKKMHSVSPMDKGEFGELAALAICEQVYQTFGGILYHSYVYAPEPGLAGNIKRSGDRLYVENTGTKIECDIILVTPYRIFPIEVKAYKAKQIVITDEAISGCAVTDKSPVHQHEMHLRHLYPKLYTVLPDGATEYLLPIVVFVDNATIVDRRSAQQRAYIPVTIRNGLRGLIYKYNIPREYDLDLKAIDRVLKDSAISYAKLYPLRLGVGDKHD